MRKITCPYREREMVTVTCSYCGKSRLIQYRGVWKGKIPELDCRSCAQDKRARVRKFHKVGEKLHDFDEMLHILEIVQANYTDQTPRMVRFTVDYMLKEYNRK